MILIRSIYVSPFEIFKSARKFDEELTDLGFSFEYNDGSKVGDFFGSVISDAEDIIVNSLGLTYKVAQAFCETLDTMVNIDILYPMDNDKRFAISADDFFEILYNHEADYLPKLLWLALVDKDKESKEKLERIYT